MAKFCTKCGRPLSEGEVCNCAAPAFANNTPQSAPIQNNNAETISINVNAAVSQAVGVWTKIKNQIGLGDPLMNETDAFEKDKKIVPDCVRPNDSEIPVRQYHIADLRKRVLGITYTKAYGRIQVTNQRVIFRAPGRCIAGRTTLQHEFAIDEIAGIETRREFVFNFWDMLLGILLFAFGGAITTSLSFAIAKEAGLLFVLSLFFAAGAGALFFLVKKKWALKLLGLGAGTLPLIAAALRAFESYNGAFLGVLAMIIAIPFIVVSLITLFIHAIKPNLALIIKTKSASEAIDIRREKNSIFSLFGGGQNEKDNHTGYSEIWPEKDAEISIREIGAMINDIQKLGDFGIEKWKQ